MKFISLFFTLSFITTISCGSGASKAEEQPITSNIQMEKNTKGSAVATFGAGCFWCVEAVFQQIKGVDTVISGYMGGKIPNPTYREICSGLTGHAEVAQITYDPDLVSFKELLEVFWQTHDPTTLNRQGADVGTQYRSAVFYHTVLQKEEAEFYKNELDAAKAFDNPIVTEITPATTFYKAEDYHQNYFRQNGDQPYCQYVIRPKMEKLEKAFKSKLK
jgi:peptide-methionine (S)-S-oxide reductase